MCVLLEAGLPAADRLLVLAPVLVASCESLNACRLPVAACWFPRGGGGGLRVAGVGLPFAGGLRC